MEISVADNQFKTYSITLPKERNFFVFVGENNSGKSTLLRAIVRGIGSNSAYSVTVNRTVLTGEGTMQEGYQKIQPSLKNKMANEKDDNTQRDTQPLQDFFNLKNADRKPIIEWYNRYFPHQNQISEKRKYPENDASAMLLEMNGFSITKQGSGARATLEIFIKLFDPKVKVLCIDEPELGLEPNLQKHLFKALKDKASPEKKIILATHSHHFLDTEDISANYTCQRDSEGKISISLVQNLKTVIFKLLGNNLSSFLFPEYILVLEGASDTIFLDRCLSLLSKNGFAVHSSDGNGNISYAVNSVKQLLILDKNELSVYSDKIYVIADKPTEFAIIQKWKKMLGNDERLKVLTQDAIEYYYPEHILQSAFDTQDDRDTIVSKYLENSPNAYNGKTISKTDLAKKIVEGIVATDLDDASNELFVFLNKLP